MKIIILTLLFGLLGYTISKPLDSKDATEALVENGQTSALHTWPLQPAPLTAYTTYGLNLLTPGQLQNNEDKQKQVQLPTIAPTAIQTSTSYGGFFMPRYLTPQQQYFAFNSAFFNAPFGQFAYTTGQQYLPQLVATIPTISTKTGGPKEAAVITTTTTTTTRRPTIRDTEPTTRKPQGSLQVKPPKLQLKPEEETNQMVGDFKTDEALLKAVEKINPQYIIEEIVNVPGQHVYSTKTTEQIKTQQKQTQTETLLSATEQKQKQFEQIKKSKAQKKLSKKSSKPVSNGVMVEAIGKTSTKGNIPEIPFGTYFLPYFSQNQQQQQQKRSSKKAAALILEPHSKAIVGNGGTAISTPISRAYLKRGVTTNVYFNPESVAIAGVGGKAHAQADLELDLIN